MAQILLIAPDPGFRALMRTVLEADKHAVREAGDGREGLRLWQDRRPHVVVTDLVMPHMDGIEVLLHIKKRCQQAKVIGLSEAASHKVVNLHLAAVYLGAYKCLTKPLDREEFVNTVNGALVSLLPQQKQGGTAWLSSSTSDDSGSRGSVGPYVR